MVAEWAAFHRRVAGLQRSYRPSQLEYDGVFEGAPIFDDWLVLDPPLINAQTRRWNSHMANPTMGRYLRGNQLPARGAKLDSTQDAASTSTGATIFCTSTTRSTSTRACRARSSTRGSRAAGARSQICSRAPRRSSGPILASPRPCHASRRRSQRTAPCRRPPRRRPSRRRARASCASRALSCVEINQCVGCTRQFFTKSFLAMTRPSRNRHRHAIEQASRRWRGGRRGYSGRTRRKI